MTQNQIQIILIQTPPPGVGLNRGSHILKFWVNELIFNPIHCDNWSEY
jgi:hypothetical protein